MSFNGSGTFSINSAGQPVVTATLISSSVFNAFTADVATGLSTCIAKDGQTTITANIPFAGFRATNVGITGIAGSVGTPAINLSDSGTGFFRPASNQIGVAVNGTQVAMFHASGLGIGMTPTAKVDVKQTTDAADGGFNLNNVSGAIGRMWLTATASPTWNFSVAGTTALSLLTGGFMAIPTSTPASAAAAGTTGTITWDSSFIYVCTATNTWQKVAIATW